MQSFARMHHVDIAKTPIVDLDGKTFTLTPKLTVFEKIKGAVDSIPQEFHEYKHFPENSIK